MKNSKLILSLFSFALLLNSASALAANCTVTEVDKTPVNFLGPVGSMPRKGDKLVLDLKGNEITADIGTIPLKEINLVLTRNLAIEKGQGLYFDGRHVSHSQAEYTLAVFLANPSNGSATGKLQIARRGFNPKLELYTAALNCTEVGQ